MSNLKSNILPQRELEPADTICSSQLRLSFPDPDAWSTLGYTAEDLTAKFNSHLLKFEHLSASQIHQHPQYKAFFERFYKNSFLDYHPDTHDYTNPRFCVAFICGLDDLFFDGALMRNLAREQFNIQFAKHSSRRWRKQAERENGKQIVDMLETSKFRGLVAKRGVTVFNNPHQLRYHDDSDSVAAEIHVYESDQVDDDRLDARARFYTGTILHECLHAFVGLYVCNCSACWKGYRDIVSLTGHGPRFLEMALRLQQLATKVFGTIDLRVEASLAEELCLLEGVTLATVGDVLDQHSYLIAGLAMDKAKIKYEMEKYSEKKSKGRVIVDGDLEMDDPKFPESVDNVDRYEDNEVYSDEDEWEGQPRNGFLELYNCYYGDC